MIIIILVVLALCLPASGDSIPSPDVKTQSLREYTLCNLDDPGLLCAMYASALETQLDSLYLEILPMMDKAPQVRHSFMEAHRTFLEYADSWALFEESSQWFDLRSGEYYFGSGSGYQENYVLCTLYWQQILYYRELVSAVSEDGFVTHLMEIKPDSLLGGY